MSSDLLFLVKKRINELEFFQVMDKQPNITKRTNGKCVQEASHKEKERRKQIIKIAKKCARRFSSENVASRKEYFIKYCIKKMKSNGSNCGLDNLDSIKRELDVYDNLSSKKHSFAPTDDFTDENSDYYIQ